jgi:hypothetical protein
MSTFSSHEPVPAADSASSTAVVVLSAEQTRAAWVELRDDQGGIVGYLARQGGTSHFFSPQEMEVVRLRAQSPPAGGKTFAEIVESVRQRAQG